MTTSWGDRHPDGTPKDQREPSEPTLTCKQCFETLPLVWDLCIDDGCPMKGRFPIRKRSTT